MRRAIKKTLSLSAFFILFIIIAATIFYKPIRILAPETAGVSCVNAKVCIDDLSRLETATALYDEALHFVDASVGGIDNPPKVVFCSSKTCAESFGLGKRSAITLGAFGIVIGPNAWKSYYVRHEMIHHLQNERWGMLKVLCLPTWFIEGMAYALSEDPRPVLTKPFECYRFRFRHWYKKVGKARLWEEARCL